MVGGLLTPFSSTCDDCEMIACFYYLFLIVIFIILLFWRIAANVTIGWSVFLSNQ